MGGELIRRAASSALLHRDPHDPAAFGNHLNVNSPEPLIELGDVRLQVHLGATKSSRFGYETAHERARDSLLAVRRLDVESREPGGQIGPRLAVTPDQLDRARGYGSVERKQGERDSIWIGGLTNEPFDEFDTFTGACPKRGVDPRRHRSEVFRVPVEMLDHKRPGGPFVAGWH